MSQEQKDQLVFVVLLAMKFLTTLRTGIDTFMVSKDILNVLLLDGVFLALWFVLAYGGGGKVAMAIRPFAAFGAYLMYGFMLVIGWEAHVDAPLVAIAVRVAGALVLLYDTWDYVVSMNQKRQESLGKTLAERQRNLREKLWGKAYKDMAHELYNEFKEQSRELLLADVESDTDYRQSLPILPPPPRQLSAGKARSENVPERSENVQEREVDTSRASVKRRWAEVYPILPDIFSRKDVEELGKCAKTQAFEAIACGKQRGEVIETNERGMYRKVTVIEGEVSEETDKQGF